jgi:hypothetical protein
MLTRTSSLSPLRSALSKRHSLRPKGTLQRASAACLCGAFDLILCVKAGQSARERRGQGQDNRFWKQQIRWYQRQLTYHHTCLSAHRLPFHRQEWKRRRAAKGWSVTKCSKAHRPSWLPSCVHVLSPTLSRTCESREPSQHMLTSVLRHLVRGVQLPTRLPRPRSSRGTCGLSAYASTVSSPAGCPFSLTTSWRCTAR